MQKLSRSELGKMLSTGNFSGIANYLPSKIENALDQPPISELERAIGKTAIVRYIEFELVTLSTLVSVGGNLNNSQIQFIAVQLVDFFPNESLADFKICMQRGAIGQYGEIYRMDGIVLRKWMEQYLSEKYDALERKLMREKDIVHQRQEMTSDDIAGKYINQMLENLKPTQKVKGITDQEIRQEGQEKPKRMPYPSTPESLYRQKELHDEWIKECHDPYTGQRNDNWIEETEWLKLRL